MKRLRYSLLTQIVVVLLMSGLLFLNVSPSPPVPGNEKTAWEGRMGYRYVHGPATIQDRLYVQMQGWPFAAHQTWIVYPFAAEPGKDEYHVVGSDWRWAGLVGDTVVCLAIVLAGGAVCEWIVRCGQTKEEPKSMQ